jgi:predicted dehydrogenase
MGDKGGADLEPLTIYREEHGALTDVTPIFPAPPKAFEQEMAAFVNAVANGTPVPIPVEDGLTVSRIIDALYRSSELGKEVEV